MKIVWNQSTFENLDRNMLDLAKKGIAKDVINFLEIINHKVELLTCNTY